MAVASIQVVVVVVVEVVVVLLLLLVVVVGYIHSDLISGGLMLCLDMSCLGLVLFVTVFCNK